MHTHCHQSAQSRPAAAQFIIIIITDTDTDTITITIIIINLRHHVLATVHVLCFDPAASPGSRHQDDVDCFHALLNQSVKFTPSQISQSILCVHCVAFWYG